jgi:hypothetical protein
LEVFSTLSEAGEKKGSNLHIQIFDLQGLAKNIKGLSKICALFLVYSQIWLNLPREYDCHFVYIFL